MNKLTPLDPGTKYGKWTVISEASPMIRKDGFKGSRSLCRCKCGSERVVLNARLKNGQSTSCGCSRRKPHKEGNPVHSERLYHVWLGMRERCNSKNNKAWKNYGGRGIKVCEEWNSYQAFKEWAFSNGYDENAKHRECTIDRIDNDGDYCPENCRWVPHRVQVNNSRKNRRITVNGITHTIGEWSTITGIKANTIHARLRYGIAEGNLLAKENLRNGRELKQTR